MTETIPPAIRVALLVILNHVEPGWENCVGLVSQWLDASNPTMQDSNTAETFNEKGEHENDLRQESIRDFETWETQQGE